MGDCAQEGGGREGDGRREGDGGGYTKYLEHKTVQFLKKIV